MNEIIDLTKILENCPEGTTFWSDNYGEVQFKCIIKSYTNLINYPILVKRSDGHNVYYTKEGWHDMYFPASCLLWPSKDQRDWSKFTAPWLKKKPKHKFHEGDWVVYNNDICQIVKREEGCNKLVTVFGIEKELVNERNLSTTRLWTIQDAKDGDVLSFYSEYRGNKMVQVGIIEKYVGKHGGCSNTFKIYVGVNWDNNLQIGEYMGCSDIHPATKEQRDLLFQKIREAGYKWNDETKTLEKLVKPKFKVGDRIRHKKTNKDDVYEISKVYDDSYGIADFTWMIYMEYQDQYELIPNKFDPKTLKPFDKVLVRDSHNAVWSCKWFSHIMDLSKFYKYATTGCLYRYCIPYNDDTKHLVGTTDEAPEFYRYWED